MAQYPTMEQMALILKSNGWCTLWSEDNWIKQSWLTDRKINVDWAGMNIYRAYDYFMNEELRK